jgi:hypothetical protein
MAGTTFAVWWCAGLRHCAVAGHDFSKTLTQIIKTRAIVPVVIGLDESRAPKRFNGSDMFGFDRSQLGAWIARANCFGAFFSHKVCQIHGKSAKRCGQPGP